MLGYKAKQGYVVFRTRIRRGGRKKMVSKGIVYGKPRNAGVNKMKCTRNLRSVAEERVGRKIAGLRVLNSYWVGEDARHRWYEIIMIDQGHKTIRNDPRINWICNATMKHRELRGVTSAGRHGRGLHKRGPHFATKSRPSKRATWKKHQQVRLRRYR